MLNNKRSVLAWYWLYGTRADTKCFFSSPTLKGLKPTIYYSLSMLFPGEWVSSTVWLGKMVSKTKINPISPLKLYNISFRFCAYFFFVFFTILEGRTYITCVSYMGSCSRTIHSVTILHLSPGLNFSEGTRVNFGEWLCQYLEQVPLC